MKRTGKMILYDWNSLSLYDDTDTIAVCLTQRQVAILKSSLVPAYWTTRWIDFPGGAGARDNLDAMISLIDSQLDGNDCEAMQMQYRDNPLDLCEVQFSTDGGLTWVTMFRKDNCNHFGIGDIINIENAKTEISNNYTNYDGDIINVAPKWEYVDEVSDQALCYALSKWVSLAMGIGKQAKIAEAEDRQSWDDLWEVLVSEISAMGVALLTLVSVKAALVTAYAWVVLQSADLIWDIVNEADVAAFEDEEAHDQVVCWLYQEMSGRTPHYHDFWDAHLSASGFRGHAKKIRAVCLCMAQDVDAYITFMLMFEDINDIASTLPACDCPEDWYHVWNFQTHGLEEWQITAPNYGIYLEDQGVSCIHIEAGGWEHNLIQYLTFAQEIYNCEYMKIYFSAIKGQWDTNSTYLIMTMNPLPNHEKNQGHLFGGDEMDTTFGFPLQDCTGSELYFRVANFEAPGNYGMGIIRAIEFGGQGSDPFTGRETGDRPW